MGVRKDIRTTGVRDHQACESVRRRGRRQYAGCLSRGFCHRSDLGVRRHHRVQSRARCGDCRRGGRAVCRSADRTTGFSWRARGTRQERKRASAGSPAGGRRQCVRDETRRRRVACADTRQLSYQRRRSQNRQQGAAYAAATGRPAVRVARRQVREIECHRVLRQGPHAGRGCGPDEPRRFGAHRRHQGAERQSDSRRFSSGFGRVFSVSRRPRRRRRGGRGRGDPARR